jgi:hypothetical protein
LHIFLYLSDVGKKNIDESFHTVEAGGGNRVISAGSLKVLKCVSSGVGVELSVTDKIVGNLEAHSS